MTTIVESYQQYRAPREHQAALVEPAFEVLSGKLSADSSSPIGDVEVCGKPLSAVREMARQEVLAIAAQYTQSYADLPGELNDRIGKFDSTVSLALSGHQPELFHSGVWFKNFLLDRLSKKSGAIGINFFVDNDLCRSAAIRVPVLRSAQPHADDVSESSNELGLATVAFDSPRDAVPWELRQLQSRETWESFPERLSKQMRGVTNQPALATRLWELSEDVLNKTGNLGRAIAAGRHRLELEHGVSNLEAPLSSLVSTRAFARFSIQLLAQLPCFQACYNEQRTRYRTAHRIRNEAHPVPALEESDGWLEGPWWVYRSESPSRKRLWVRMVNDQLILSDRAGWQASIEGRLDCDNAATQWLDILGDGVLLRPRALLTTMYLRLIVSDLFVHGIGGGKYDQLTDGIMRQFFDIEPPQMAVASATLHLPARAQAAGTGLPSGSVQEIEAQISASKKKLWDLQHHADQFASDLSPQGQQLVARKADLLQQQPPKGERWQWHQEMKATQQQLRSLTESLRQDTRDHLHKLERRLKQAQILESREYSFSIFPEDEIVGNLQNLANHQS